MDIILHYFSNEKGKQQIDKLAVMLSFVRLFSFLTNQKINAVLEQRKGRLRGLVDFEAKAMDLNFQAKAKHFKMSPLGQSHSRGLHLCKQDYGYSKLKKNLYEFLCA